MKESKGSETYIQKVFWSGFSKELDHKLSVSTTVQIEQSRYCEPR